LHRLLSECAVSDLLIGESRKDVRNLFLLLLVVSRKTEREKETIPHDSATWVDIVGSVRWLGVPRFESFQCTVPIFEGDSDYYKVFEQVIVAKPLAHGALAGKRWNLSRFVAWLSALRIRNADMLIGIAPDPATYIRAGLSPL
jgi:hypothetical protein